MKTQVVNVRVRNIRPKYHDLKEWMQDPNNVYIGRKQIVFIDGKRFPPRDSPFANPFRMNGDDACRSTVLCKYREYITNKINNGEIQPDDLRNLIGKNLGCWCHPEACHGDILVEFIETISK